MGRYTTMIFIAALIAGCKSDPAPTAAPPAAQPVEPSKAVEPAPTAAEPPAAPAADPAAAAPAAADNEAAQAACEAVLAKVAECRSNKAFKSQVNQTQLKALALVLADVKKKANFECLNWIEQGMVQGGPRFADASVRESLLQATKGDCETFGHDFSAAGGFPVDIAGND